MTAERRAIDDQTMPVVLAAKYRRLIVRTELLRTGRVTRLPRLHSAADVYRDFQDMSRLDREVFLVLLLDNKNRVTGVNLVSVGSLCATVVHPREVYKAAILANASGVLVVHNHPSGDPTPSREDRDITARLQASGEILGIPLVDHIVVAAEGFRSFAEAGFL